MALTEDSKVEVVAGKAAAAQLAKAKGIRTVGDLLEQTPRRYLPTNELTDLSSLRAGEVVVVVAQVLQATTQRQRRDPRRQMLTVVLTDGTRRLGLTFFSTHGHAAKLVPGVVGIFLGTVSSFNDRWQLTHPEYEVLGRRPPGEALVGADLLEGLEGMPGGGSKLEAYRGRALPVYSTTGKVSSLAMRRMVESALDSLTEVRDPLPEALRARRGLVSRREAMELVHRPRLTDRPEQGMERLRYDEAFVLQTILAQRRQAVEALEGTARRPRPGGLLDAFDAALPFELTAGQREVGELVLRELGSSRPMHRLLQGEVGSGKTVVALRAMLAVIDSGGQAALLAPTEVLAAQHHRSLTQLLGPLALGGMLGGSELGTRVTLLTGSQNSGARRAALNEIVTGDAGIVVGTHALIQEHVAFHDLALVVVDEQHRFGVEQRDALREKGRTPPHLLVMTATPIPRTVAMTVFGDMETVTLRELPAGRSPITTHIVEAGWPPWVARTWKRVAEEVAAGHQAYVVCPKIGDSGDGALGPGASGGRDDEDGLDDPDAQTGAEHGSRTGARAGGDEVDGSVPAAEGADPHTPRELTGVYAMLATLEATPAMAGVRLGVLHGRLDPDTKERTMRAFAAGKIDVLVATTVVEVGVDVANASVMVVMDADRFGISQLHQLRGRVGRGSVPGLCLLMTETEPGSLGRARLEAVAATTDGFVLARRDLELRREGDVLGAQQSGRASSVRFLRMGRSDDEELIGQAREDATALVAGDPTLRDHPVLAARVAARLDEEQAAYLERG